MYYILYLNAGLAPIEADLPKRMHQFLLATFIGDVFFYTILLCFKLSLLFFFRRLGRNINKFNYLWWPILVLSFCTWTISIADTQHKCVFGDVQTIITYCNSAAGTKFLRDTLDANCALDVVVDFLGKIVAHDTAALIT